MCIRDRGNTGRLNFIALSCMNRNRYETEPGYGETRYDANQMCIRDRQAAGQLFVHRFRVLNDEMRQILDQLSLIHI